MIDLPGATWPSYSEEEIDAVTSVLRSNKVNYWTGTEARVFEKEFASFADSEYAIAVANGTVAIDLALKALNIGDGDEVVVTSRTFIASVSAIVNAGAKPVFADVDIDSQNITPQTIEEVLTSRTKAIICVHLAGWPCEMDEIMSLAEKRKLKVIEDCAQAHGATYKGRSVGSFGHVSAWSFCQDKIMTTGGEGGMVTTNDAKLWNHMWSYKDHGKSFDAVYKLKHPPGFRWLHESFGTNWRMTEMQAAIGRVQLTQMSTWKKQRQKNASTLANLFGKYDFLRVPSVPSYLEHANYKYYCFVVDGKLPSNWSRDRLLDLLNEVSVPCMQGSCSEVYLEKAFERGGLRPRMRLPVAKLLGETSMMFLVHPTIDDNLIAELCNRIRIGFDRVEKDSANH